jgi:hypothetical protein
LFEGEPEMKKEESEIIQTPYSPRFKSYSVDEILAAGGPSAFARKMNKSLNGLSEELEKLPSDAFLTDDEFNEAMATLNASK